MARKKIAEDSELPFEAALDELEKLVEELESGQLSLAESLQKFERGITRARQCQQALEAVQQKVRMLNDTGNGSDDKGDQCPDKQ